MTVRREIAKPRRPRLRTPRRVVDAGREASESEVRRPEVQRRTHAVRREAASLPPLATSVHANPVTPTLVCDSPLGI